MESDVNGEKPSVLKSIRRYFFKFLMMFLAVVAGFFSENIREGYADKRKGEEYIVSIVEDLRFDIKALDSILSKRRKKEEMLDSLLVLLNGEDLKKHGNEIYYFARWAPRVHRFYNHDRTIIQLRNSGDWHLIQKKEVSDALQFYDERVRSLDNYIAQREESLVLIMYQSTNKLFDNRTFNNMLNGLSFKRPTNNPQLHSYDKEAINEFANQVHFLQNANQYYIDVATTLQQSAKQTLALIEREYASSEFVQSEIR
ncbi:MAG TPA: hypothetical protein VL728_04400 [Cyclobacteriaceae bacterium]|nr:hypothetical protein [Cyclobacteriaceae bacterium]